MLRGAGWVFIVARRPHRVRLAASIRAIAVVDAKRLVGSTADPVSPTVAMTIALRVLGLPHDRFG
jgi:hypothetical protein